VAGSKAIGHCRQNAAVGRGGKIALNRSSGPDKTSGGTGQNSNEEKADMASCFVQLCVA
jgi:hypothetical protein